MSVFDIVAPYFIAVGFVATALGAAVALILVIDALLHPFRQRHRRGI